MAKRLSLEEKLAKLKELETNPGSSDVPAELRKALNGPSNVLAAKAAKIAAKLGIKALLPNVADAFERFMTNPVKTDPGCRAKLAAVEALNTLGYEDVQLFLRGIRHIQMEPSFGPPVDTADTLRAACAFALYRLGYPELFNEMAALLADRQSVARRAAVRVLLEAANDTAEAMLRMKVLQGDKEPDVIADCFAALLAISPARSLPFVAGFLIAQDPLTVEDAALALGNSRTDQAFEILRGHWEESSSSQFKKMLLLPIALTRCNKAFDLLINVVEKESPPDAVAALKALAVCANTDKRRDRTRHAAESRKDPTVSRVCKEEFPSSVV
jgi:HEAT repeat protein